MACREHNIRGEPCGAAEWQDGYCRWHHPEHRNQQREASIRGGRARSNRARAQKAFDLNQTRNLSDLLISLYGAIEQVLAGSLDPGPANAAANLARAIATIAGVADFQKQLEAMRAELEALQQERSA